MAKTLTEEKVLKKLGIEDFRHLTKENVIELAAMQDKMSPEVAKKAIEQFPEFSKTMSEILSDYKVTLDKGLAANNESVKRYYDSCNATILSLQKQLERRPLTFKKRKYIIDKMMELSNEMGEKDTENKKFILRLVGLGVTGAVAIATVAGKIIDVDK